jgi:cobalt transporter subunit CbtB
MKASDGDNQGGCGKLFWENRRMAQTKAADHTAVVQIRATQVVQASLAALLGIALFVGVALSSPTAVHNAAHDSRHGISVPCH